MWLERFGGLLLLLTIIAAVYFVSFYLPEKLPGIYNVLTEPLIWESK